MSEILEDPMMWFVLAFLAGLILTVVFGLLSMAAHILAELALMVDRKIRSHYRNRHVIRRMREARREVAAWERGREWHRTFPTWSDRSSSEGVEKRAQVQ